MFLYSIGDDNKTLSGEFVSQSKRDETLGLWDISLSGKIKRQNITINPTDIYCTIIIPNTTYIKRKKGYEFSKLSFLISVKAEFSTLFPLLKMHVRTYNFHLIQYFLIQTF